MRRHQYLPKTVALREEMIDWLGEEAERRGCSVSELVRQILACFREHMAECEQLCQQPRLLGSHRAEHARTRWAEQRRNEALSLIGRRGNSKRLTDDERAEIWRLYNTRQANQQTLADAFHVSRPTIAKIVNAPPGLSAVQPEETAQDISIPGTRTGVTFRPASETTLTAAPGEGLGAAVAGARG